MKVKRGSKGTAPLILNFGTKLRLVPNFTPRPICHREMTVSPFE